MSKPTYHYICPCGFRTNRAWRFVKHKKEHQSDKKK